jgi:hypothetical protein
LGCGFHKGTPNFNGILVDDLPNFVSRGTLIYGQISAPGSLASFIFLGVLLFGIHRMSPDEIDLMRVLLVVLGPFAFDFWWITMRHLSSNYRAKRLIAERSETGDDYTHEELKFLEQVGKPRHLRNLGILIVSFIGSVLGAFLFHNSGEPKFIFGVLAGIFSPAILITAYEQFLRFN